MDDVTAHAWVEGRVKREVEGGGGGVCRRGKHGEVSGKGTNWRAFREGHGCTGVGNAIGFSGLFHC